MSRAGKPTSSERLETVLSGDQSVHVECGDALAILRSLPDSVVQTVCTSPPYYRLRNYGVAGQLGLERTPDEYIARLVDVFREVRRVLRPDGTVWLNLGDSYATGAPLSGLKPKDLIGIPWRVAFALQSDGWWLRSDCIWAKKNPMPESIRDRPTKAHEYVFLFAKSADYFYDSVASAEPAVSAVAGSRRNRRTVWFIASRAFKGAHFAVFPPDLIEPCVLAGTSERGGCSICGAPWRREIDKPAVPIAAEYLGKWRNADAHSAGRRLLANVRAAREAGREHDRPFSSKKTVGWSPTCGCGGLDVKPCLVLDPFSGAGTTGVVARKHGLRYIGIDLNAEYVALSQRRIRDSELALNYAAPINPVLR